MNLKRLFILLFACIQIQCNAFQSEDPNVRTGAEMMISNHLSDLEGRNIGLVMNPTARILDTHVLDTLLALGVNIKALYSPEHGFRGEFSDGEIIKDGVDQESGLPVFSLYGSTKKPTKEMLGGIDLLIFDMQDVGARFYTFNSTMRYVIEAASEQNIEVWILDRPNPAGGNYVSGWILNEQFESMVGSHYTPVAHGMTMGELAMMGIGEGWYEVGDDPNVKVIRMEGWNRDMKWPETGLPWIPPSPNLPTFEHAYVYLGTCFIEGTTLSEGRGTSDPFLLIGAPDFQAELDALNALRDKFQVELDTISFTPISIPGKSTYPKYEDQLVNGVKINITAKFNQPVEFGVHLTNLMTRNTPSSSYRNHMNLLTGYQATNFDSLKINWESEVENFRELRKKYLLY